MRQLLRRIGPRLGIPLGLVMVIAVVVAIARLGGAPGPEPHNIETEPTPTVATTVGDDAEVAPPPSAFADDGDLRSAASAFTAAWLRRTLPAADWLDELRPLCTLRLMELLNGVDPLDVPLVVAAGEPVVLLRSELYAQVRVPINSEAVLLGLVKQGDRWLVDGLDRDTG